MQNQGSSSNSSQANLHFNGELRSDQQRVFPNVASVHDGHNNSMRWNVGQSSSSLQLGSTGSNYVCFRRILSDDCWLSPLGNQSGTAQNEARTIGLSQGNVGVNSGEHGAIGTPSRLSGQQNLDLNAGVDEGNDNGPNLSLDLFAVADHDQIQNISSVPPSSGPGGSSGSSSSPLMIYSGIAGYVVEENMSGEGAPVEGGGRLLCKRRAPDHASSSSSSAQQQTRNIIPQQPAPAVTASNANDNATNISTLTAATSLNSLHSSSSGHAAVQLQPTASNLNHIPNQTRNVRLRRSSAAAVAGGQQNPTPTATPWSLNSSNINHNVSNVQTMGQSTAFFPSSLNTSSATTPVTPPAMQQPIGLGQVPQPSPLQSAVNQRETLQSAINQREIWRWEENLINNRSRNTANIIPWANMQANLNLANRVANNNILASSSRVQAQAQAQVQVQAGSGIHIPSSSSSTMRFPQPNTSDQYAQRLQDIVYRSEASRQVNYCPIHSPTTRNSDVSLRGAYARPAQIPLRSGLRADRQAAATQPSALPPTLTTAQRRSRLISEVHNALGLVRRGGVFRFEDVMVIDRSYLYGLPEVPDFRDDMRLDVDNMSYEELLDLEEQIGNVSTGLTEEAIMANLRRRKYQPITPVEPEPEPEPCCICQEDYANGEEMGKLDCGHDFHFNCIKQWLVQKNSCPICKKTALAI